MDDIIRAELGALLVIGDPNALSFLYSGGMRLDLPFTSQLIYELAKMDGAIILNETAQKIVYANVQLMPDPSIASEETGTRHRTAERVAKQTEALVISISQQRETVTIFVRDLRYQLGEISDVLARTNQALGTLETYRQRLDQGLTRLTALEFQSAVMLDDVLVVVQRAEMTTRMAEEIERNCVELGGEGRLIRMQLDELMEDVPRDKASIVYDYEPSGEPQKAAEVLERLAGLTHTQLLEFEELSRSARLRRARRIRSTTGYSPVATGCSRGSRGFRTTSFATSCRTFPRSMRSSGRATGTSRRSTASVRSGRARSARACGGCRSTILLTAICSFNAPN